jgi:hypothetical protein
MNFGQIRNIVPNQDRRCQNRVSTVHEIPSVRNSAGILYLHIIKNSFKIGDKFRGIPCTEFRIANAIFRQLIHICLDLSVGGAVSRSPCLTLQLRYGRVWYVCFSKGATIRIFASIIKMC